MKRCWPLVLSSFAALTAVAWYGCWASSDEYMVLHNFDKPYHEAPWSDVSEWVAGPGYVISQLVFNRTDIPERDPDSWRVAWLIAPSGAAIWIGLFFAMRFAFLYLWQRVCLKLGTPKNPISN
jgi:hypothetical protein